MPSKLYTNFEYIEKLQNKYGKKFTLLSEYIGSKNKIMVRCNDCGKVQNRLPVKLLYNGSCRGCFDVRHTKTHKAFESGLKDRYGDEYTLLSKYTYDKDKIIVRHNQCGAEYEIIASNLLRNGGCKFCLPKRLRMKFTKTTEEFKKYIKQVVGDEYSILEDYVNANIHILFKHNVCGNEYRAKPNIFIQGNRCPKCAIEARKSKDTTNRKISKNIRPRIIHVLRGRTKSSSTVELIGCSVEDLRVCLERQFSSGMNWDNYGKRNGWQIDHVRPCASFDLSEPKQQKECFHYTNMQPLWASDNIAKHSWWNGIHYGVDIIAKKATQTMRPARV